MMPTRSQVEAAARRYPKFIEWSRPDRRYVGSAPPLIGPCCHGRTEEAVLLQLRQIVEEWLSDYYQLRNSIVEHIDHLSTVGATIR